MGRAVEELKERLEELRRGLRMLFFMMYANLALTFVVFLIVMWG